MWSLAMDNDAVKFIMIFGTGGLVAIVAIVFSAMRSIIVARAKEQTKREVAAYVAEGTLDPDKAVAMLNAGQPTGEDDDESEGACC